MRVNWKGCLGVGLLAGWLAMGLGVAAHAQGAAGSAQQPSPGAPGPATTPASPPPGDAAKESSLPLDAPPPVNAEEDAAFQAFQEVPASDTSKKIELGEAFQQKYPQSRYLPVIYSSLTKLYLETNQVQKMEDVGDKEVQLSPTDVQTMAILGQTIPRTVNGNMSGAEQQKQLAKAEDYSKRAIEVTPTIAKPAELTDEQFATAKNLTLAMAHSGLGLVYVRRGKYADAIPELDQSVKLDPAPDPVNYYLLGLANEKAAHFTEAVDAFNKCAGLQSSLQPTCKSGAEEAKKLANTQLSVPK
jgi:tetratricopeptide (TPR) repeat protein